MKSSPELKRIEGKLALWVEGFKPLFIDFADPIWKRRAQEGKKQGLIRACKPEPGMLILDSTAGWGRDAVILAHYGARVVMLERHPMMAALLHDALARLPECSPLRQRLTLIAVDAKEYLQTLPESAIPDVVYIDPMHPTRQKSALVKKDMQALQQLVAPDEDALALITLAKTKSRHRTVVKWPQNQPALLPPDFSCPGSTVRFDVYTPHH